MIEASPAAPRGIGWRDVVPALVFLLGLAVVLPYALVSPVPHLTGMVNGQLARHYERPVSGRIEQGWPVAYLERVDTSSSSVWKLTSGVTRFSWATAAADILIALAIPAAISVASWLHLRRRAWWTCSIGELFVATALVGVCAYVVAWPNIAFQNEQKTAAALERIGWEVDDVDFISPDWFARPLVQLGYVDLMKFERVKVLSWHAERDVPCTTGSSLRGRYPPPSLPASVDDSFEESGPHLARLHDCKELIICSSRVTDRGMHALCTNMRGCEKLTIRQAGGFTDRTLAEVAAAWPQLESVGLLKTSVSEAGIPTFARLPRLKMIWIGGNALSAEGAHRILKECGQLEQAQFEADASFKNTPAEWERARKLATDRGVHMTVIFRQP